jgi:hypothetical protein
MTDLFEGRRTVTQPMNYKSLVDDLEMQMADGIRPIVYNGETDSAIPFNNVKKKVCYMQFNGLAMIIFKDGTWSIEDTTGG